MATEDMLDLESVKFLELQQYVAACIDYVKQSCGIELDFTVETLPVLDHYLREARSPLQERAEATPLVALVAGCYLGELLRERHQFVWSAPQDDPQTWRLDWPKSRLTVFPVAIATMALLGPRAKKELLCFELDPKDEPWIREKLDALPAVSPEEYWAPSTRVEVIDILVDALTASAGAPAQPRLTLS